MSAEERALAQEERALAERAAMSRQTVLLSKLNENLGLNLTLTRVVGHGSSDGAGAGSEHGHHCKGGASASGGRHGKHHHAAAKPGDVVVYVGARDRRLAPHVDHDAAALRPRHHVAAVDVVIADHAAVEGGGFVACFVACFKAPSLDRYVVRDL